MVKEPKHINAARRDPEIKNFSQYYFRTVILRDNYKVFLNSLSRKITNVVSVYKLTKYLARFYQRTSYKFILIYIISQM